MLDTKGVTGGAPVQKPASMLKGSAPAVQTVGLKPAAPAPGAATTTIPPASTSNNSGAPASSNIPTSARLLSATAGAMQQQRSDRLVTFLATLVTHPFMFLLTKRAAAISMSQMSAVGGGGGIDTRKRLADFPEGAALLELESWCQEPVFTSWVYEWATRLVVFVRQLLLTYLPYPIVVQVLHSPWLLRTLQSPPQRTLQQVLTDYMPRAELLMQQGNPHVAVRELQPLIEPSLVALKSRLEERLRLSRGPTLLERLDFFTYIARWSARLFFTWLRGLARLCTYTSSLLSVVSGALSFTVVPSIVLSVISAMLGVCQLLLMGTADLLEPAVNAMLALTESSKDTAAALGGTPESSPVSCRVLPASTVEQLEPFFDKQLKLESGLLNRPEIPHLASMNRPLLVKAYDLGLIDARGKTEARVIAEMLATADAQSLSHVLLRSLSRAAVAATSFDVPALLTVLQQTGEGVAGAVLPAFMGGSQASLRHLFRPDGFFVYADDRQAQVATVLLARLLSWLHLSQVVCPGSPDCLRFVLVMGERQAGKASLFTRLVDAPADYAGHLGGTAAGSLDGSTGMGAQTSSLPSGVVPAPSSSSRSKSSFTSSSGSGMAPAVDMQQLAGQPNTYVVCVPGLHSADVTTRQVAQRLAGSLGGMSSAVVFLVHPSSEPSPAKLSLLVPALVSGCHCLVAINGPSRVEGLAAGRATTGTSYPPGRPANTPLETLRARWQSAAEALCAQHGLNLSLLGVLATEIVQADGAAELPAGVQHFSQVQDWVATTAAQAQRKV